MICEGARSTFPGSAQATAQGVQVLPVIARERLVARRATAEATAAISRSRGFGDCFGFRPRNDRRTVIGPDRWITLRSLRGSGSDRGNLQVLEFGDCFGIPPRNDDRGRLLRAREGGMAWRTGVLGDPASVAMRLAASRRAILLRKMAGHTRRHKNRASPKERLPDSA
jgi:hypothetical protein